MCCGLSHGNGDNDDDSRDSVIISKPITTNVVLDGTVKLMVTNKFFEFAISYLKSQMGEQKQVCFIRNKAQSENKKAHNSDIEKQRRTMPKQ